MINLNIFLYLYNKFKKINSKKYSKYQSKFENESKRDGLVTPSYSQ